MDTKTIRETVLSAQDVKLVPVSVPEWGMPEGLFVRELSAYSADEYNSLLFVHTDAEGRLTESVPWLRTALVCKALCDAEGNRVFADADLEALGAKSGPVMERLYLAAKAVNEIDVPVEEAAKN
jgi:hypothetical protein